MQLDALRLPQCCRMWPETKGASGMARAHETIRIPRLRAFAAAVGTLVLIGIMVFLQRYRGADRTAMVLSVLGGAGLCLVVGLSWFQRRFSGRVMTRLTLWGIGLRSGAVAGACNSGVSVVLLALRWAIDQQASPFGDHFLPAFLHALAALGMHTARGFPAYAAAGAVVGGLVGLTVAEAIGISAERIPSAAPAAPADGEPFQPSKVEG
jgi:hypothetical protein